MILIDYFSHLLSGSIPQQLPVSAHLSPCFFDQLKHDLLGHLQQLLSPEGLHCLRRDCQVRTLHPKYAFNWLLYFFVIFHYAFIVLVDPQGLKVVIGTGFKYFKDAFLLGFDDSCQVDLHLYFLFLSFGCIFPGWGPIELIHLKSSSKQAVPELCTYPLSLL